MEKENSNQPTILTKKEKIISFGLAVFALAAPLIFTRTALFFGVSFSDTGEIGDTIGGISAPFIGLIAAFLVYKSFEAQIEANHSQIKNHKEQINTQQLNHREQILLLSSELYTKYLFELYDNIENDYYSQENKHNHSGWANELKNGLARLNKLPDYKSEWQNSQSVADILQQGRRDVYNSIGKVLFVYRNFILLLDSMENILVENDNFNVRIACSYIIIKVDNLFNQNNYNVLLNYDFESWGNNEKVDSSTLEDLKLGVIAANKIKSLINSIQEHTDKQNTLKPTKK